MSDYSREVDEHLHQRIEHNMTNHAPSAQEVVARFEALREFAKNFSHAIVDLCPEGRDRSLALTHAEDALMRAVASIARNQDAMVGANMPAADDFTDILLPGGPQMQRCTCPPGPEEDSIIPSAECREHGHLLAEPVQGAGPGVEDLERQAAEALTEREYQHTAEETD